MAKTKKELTDLEKVTKAFKEDFDDKELQERFDIHNCIILDEYGDKDQ